uniref:Uncharacterized protein n=1 Tax=viral metagenome TaxID=1070528 RepID=A0A6H1ZIZ0_9ZZZZ
MEYVILGAAVAFVGFQMWLSERREARWHRTLNDLINKKMAKDFYDYVYGTEVLKKAENPQQQLFADIEEQIRNKRDQGKVPEFINQRRNMGAIPTPNKEY